MRAKSRSLDETETFHQQMQQEINQLIQERTQQDFALLQQNGCDALKLGRWLQTWYPQLVQNDNWEKQFSALEIEVQMKTKIKSYELK